MKNKGYVKYGLKRFCLYLLIGIIVSFIPLSYMGVFFAFPSIMIASVLLSFLEAVRLKNIEELGKNSHEVFTKPSLIAIIIAVLISACYNCLLFASSENSNASVLTLIAIAIIAVLLLMGIFSIIRYFCNRNKK